MDRNVLIEPPWRPPAFPWFFQKGRAKKITMNNTGKGKLDFRRLFFLFLLPAAILAACSKNQENKSVLSENVIAIVNQEYIYKEDFESGLEQFLSKYKISKASPAKEGAREPKNIVLEQLIQNKLFDQEIKRLSITVSIKELEDELRQIAGEYTKEELTKRLKEKNLSLQKWKDEVRRNLLIKKLIDREVIQKINVDEKDMHGYYEANKESFSLPKRAEVYHIIVPDESEARDISKELLSGADFNEMAQKHSLGFEAAAGGKMGIFSPGQLPEEFDNVIFKLGAGQHSDVIKTPYGYHLFKVTKIIEPKKMDFEEARKDIRKNLIKDKEKDAYPRWVHNLKANSKIVINKNLKLQ